MFTPIELIGAAAWRRAFFTTYALSLSFFEAVVLDALVRGRSHEALVLSDILGVRSALSEQGAQRAGKDYEVEPIAAVGGVFHPKITALTTDDDCHILVGSGNLTFNGWGGNLEVVEHLHPSFAADAIDDVAGFFETLASASRVRHGVETRCLELASDLRRVVRGKAGSGNIRFIHSLEDGIAQQVANIASDLGGATRVSMAAPFWDEGQAVDAFCAGLGLSEVFVHSHEHGTVVGDVGRNWPSNSRTSVRPVRIEALKDAGDRLLHAKMFEIVCRQGRIVVSGSANATTAALGTNHNVEACVVRVSPNNSGAWSFSASVPPDLIVPAAAVEDDELEHHGVLRAALVAGNIEGRVLAPRMTGSAKLYHLTGEGPKLLGECILDRQGCFSVQAPAIELEAWRGGRLVVRAESGAGARAEGFVSIAAFSEVKRRAGAFAPRLFALLAGTEMPNDVAAVMSFLHDNPQYLGAIGARRMSGGAAGSEQNDTVRMISLDQLDPIFAHRHQPTQNASSAEGAGWQRFLALVLSAFREKRGALSAVEGRPSDDDEEDDVGQTQDAPPDPAIPRALENFKKLFDYMLSIEGGKRHALLAFEIMRYVCGRLRPDNESVRSWVSRLASVLSRAEGVSERRQDVAAFYLYWFGLGEEHERARNARSHILRAGYSMAGEGPAIEVLSEVNSILPMKPHVRALWDQLRSARTYPEHMRSFLCAIETGDLSAECDDLAAAIPTEWRVLKEVIANPARKTRVHFIEGFADACPRCAMGLPQAEQNKLRTIGAATAANCCGKILVDRSI